MPKQYPALIRSRKVIKKARKEGYDFGSAETITEKIKSLAASLDKTEGDEREDVIAELIWYSSVLASPDTDMEKKISDKINDFIDQF